MYLLISRLVYIDCKSVKAQNTNIITWPCPVLLVFWVWVMLIVSVVGGLGGVAGSLDGITLRETRGWISTLSQLSALLPRSTRLRRIIGKLQSSWTFHLLSMPYWRSTQLMVCQGWSWIFIDAVMAIKCGPQWRMIWILRTKWTKPKS